MPRPKREPVKHYSFRSYDVGGFEGGIGVFVVDAEHGTRVLSIPRFNLSTLLDGIHDHSSVRAMFQNSRYTRNEKFTDELQEMIISDL